MAVIRVYGNSGSSSTMRVVACLYEKDLDFEFVPVDMVAGDHKKEPFISMNPFGQVPAFEDGDLKLFDSRAITQYIAQEYSDRGTQLIYQETKQNSIILMWKEVEAHQFNPAASKLTWELIIKPMLGMATDQTVVEENEAKLGKVLDVYEERLSKVLSFKEPFEDGDLELFESRAITKYIACQYANKGTELVYSDMKKEATALVWLEVEAQQFESASSKLLWEIMFKPMFGMTTDPAAAQENEAKLEKVLDIYENRLSKSKYIGGESFTLADLHHLPNIGCLLTTSAKWLFESRPHVNAWIADITARPAWAKVLALKNQA